MILAPSEIERFLQEDDHYKNAYYLNSLPNQKCRWALKIKDDLVLAGLPFFIDVFNFLGAGLNKTDFLELEGKRYLQKDSCEILFELPFSMAIAGERCALNLIQHASSIATFVNQFVQKAPNIKILDTRKTLPGLRAVEKYAIRIGGGFNHRFGQSEILMIKDNHKKMFGGLKEAYEFFNRLGSFYSPVIAEIHSEEEIDQAIQLGIKHLLIDNFSAKNLERWIPVLKEFKVTIEVSGGVNLETVEEYSKLEIDAISVGQLTTNAPRVDLSFKMQETL